MGDLGIYIATYQKEMVFCSNTDKINEKFWTSNMKNSCIKAVPADVFSDKKQFFIVINGSWN